MALEVKDLKKSFKKRTVVNGVSLNISKGEIVGLLGPNGAGKSTSFYMIVGLLKPEQGSIILDGEDITKLPMYKRCKAGIGYLPQEPVLDPEKTVKEVIEESFVEVTNALKRLDKVYAEYADGIRRFTFSRSAGSCLMTVSDKGVTVDFYAGASENASTRFVLR